LRSYKWNVHVISRKTLREFALRHNDAEAALDTWFRCAKRANWKNLAEVRLVYPHADNVGECTVFNIRGNRFRLICGVDYEAQVVYIRRILTHQQYDRGEWKRGC
jgi:mRNA interferase HigB